jgi:rod shape-determining protein MreD
MSALLRFVGVALALLLAQQLAVVLLPGMARPDLPLAFALAMGLRARPTEGLLLAFALGYAVDALSGAPPGLNALLAGTACAGTRLADRALYLRAVLPWTAWVVACAAASPLLVGAALASFSDVPPPWLDLLLHAPGTAIATALCALPLQRILRQIEAGAEREAAGPLIARAGRP